MDEFSRTFDVDAFRAVPLPQEEEILSLWGRERKDPFVSIICITFNHASFLEDALRGFLSQRTTFPFEIIIHDDASTDGTQQIIENFRLNYPSIIKPILQQENKFSLGIKPVTLASAKARGKYIAFCEGDDFWTDPDKLQKQVEFLEKNPDYVISGHDAFIINEAGVVTSQSKLPNRFKRNYSMSELVGGQCRLLTMSWVYRAEASEFPPEFRMVKNGDTFRLVLFGRHGKAKYHSDIGPAAYRVHPGGVWSMQDGSTSQDDLLNTRFWIYRYFKRTGEFRLAEIHATMWFRETIRLAPFALLLREVLVRLFWARRWKALVNARARKFERVGPEAKATESTVSGLERE